MPRGYVWAQYGDDEGTPWIVRVDADHALEFARGWITTGLEGLYPLPRLWSPRRAVGIDESGRTQSAICADVGCDLWTGATDTFTVEANDNVIVTATVIARLGERRHV